MSLAPFSCIIPVYNGQDYIQQTLEALATQTLPLTEIRIIDDGSTDSTVAVCQEWMAQYSGPTTLHLHCQEQNEGLSKTRNIGTHLAWWNWVLYLDADDIPAPDFVEKVHHAWATAQSKASEAILFYPTYYQMDAWGNIISPLIPPMECAKEDILGNMFLRNFLISPSGVLIQRDAVIAVGGFDDAINYNQDWHLWLRLLIANPQHPWIGVKEAKMGIRRHGNNMSGNAATMLAAEKIVLSKFTLEQIQSAILQRQLPPERNKLDYAAMLFRLEQWSEGRAILEQLVTAGCQDSALFFHLGLYAIYRQNWQEAQDAFEATLRQSPQHGSARNNLACVYVLQGNRSLALSLLTGVLQDFPGYRDAEYNLQNLHSLELNSNSLKWTWRELRLALTHYNAHFLMER